MENDEVFDLEVRHQGIGTELNKTVMKLCLKKCHQVIHRVFLLANSGLTLFGPGFFRTLKDLEEGEWGGGGGGFAR